MLAPKYCRTLHARAVNGVAIGPAIVVVFVALAAAACSSSNSSSSQGSLPSCLPGGQQALIVPSPGASSVPITPALTVYIASAGELPAQGNYRVVLVNGAGTTFFGSGLEGPVPEPPPTPNPNPTPFPGTVYYETTGFALNAGQTYTAEISSQNCAAVPITGAVFTTATAMRTVPNSRLNYRSLETDGQSSPHSTFGQSARRSADRTSR